MTINLRNEFESLLKKDGWNIYLRRRTNDTGQNSYTNKLEKHTVRNYFGASNKATSAAQEQEEGVAVTADNVFYFKWDVNPGEGDLVYEQFPNQKSNTVVWKIDYAQPFRGFRGQIIYWVAGVTREYVEGNTTATAKPLLPIEEYDAGGAAAISTGVLDGGNA